MTKSEFLKIPGVKAKLDELATKYEFTVDQILTVIQKESNFNTKAENSKSKATGLIQFMPDTAQGLGTSIEQIAEMDAIAQLDLVDKYFEQNHTKGEHPYITVAYPAAANMGMDDIIADSNSIIAAQNPVWQDESGNVTKKSILSYVGVAPEEKSEKDTKISHKLQLGVQIGDKGGITNEQENKLEELGLTLTKRAGEGDVIFHEIETENLDKAKEIIKILKDNGFENAFIRHTKTNLDGSTVRISDKELYNETGEISYKYKPEGPRTVIVDDEQAEQIFKENFEILTEEPEGPKLGDTDPTGTGLVWDGTAYVKPEGTSETAVWDGSTWAEPEVSPPAAPLTRGQQLLQGGESLLKGAGKVLDYIGGPGAIVSYIMGKKGLKAAMKEIEPQKRAELSPMFMQHLRQSRELAKKGFHPDAARKIRKEMDGAYQLGLENAVRGSGGDRAKFLARSGVLDAQRSSALLDYAVKDEQLQMANADKYEKLMLFKENFDLERTEADRAEDMARQVADKKAAAGFTSAAFTNLISGFGRSSALTNQYSGANQLYSQLQNMFTKPTGTNE